MKILLLGDFSGVYHNLAMGLRALGHEVTVASDGSRWRNYPRDIDITRTGKLQFLLKLVRVMPRLRGYDIVQIIHPLFLPLKAERLFGIYNYLRRHNRRVVLGVMADDYYYSHINSTLKPMRYSDLNIGAEDHTSPLSRQRMEEWEATAKGALNRYIAADVDAIVAGAYEYWLPYHLTGDVDKRQRPLRDKLFMVPFPFKLAEETHPAPSDKMRVFIGIDREYMVFKGADILLDVAKELQARYPDRMTLTVAENVPYKEYCHMMDNSDVMLDQLYSYGPGMNALLTLSKGIITLTGAEPEYYELMGEHSCRPIINVTPDRQQVFNAMEQLLLNRDKWAQLKRESREYVLRNHHYEKVARQYEDIYSTLLRQ